MAKIITLKYAGKCADCGASLPVGTRAKWYGRGRVYGLDCHSRRTSPDPTIGYEDGEPLGLTYSRYDKYGVYSYDGRKLGSTCNCEDYPCCGH